MAEKIVIAQLDIDVNQLVKNTAKLKKEIDVIKDDQKTLKALGKESSESFIKNAADLKALTGAYNQNVKALSTSTNSLRDNSEATNLLVNSLNKEVTTISEARNQNKLLNKLRNETNATTVEGQKIITDLNAKLDKNNEFIKQNADQYLKQKINIGNYSESVKDALQQTGLFGGSLGKIQSSLAAFAPIFGSIKSELSGVVTQFNDSKKATEGYTAAQKAAAVATSGVSAALKIFRLALIATGIGAIVVVIGTLITFLASTQEGIDKVTSVTRPLQAVFGALVGVLQSVGKFLFEAFSKPKQTISELVDFVKNQVARSFQSFFKILKGIATLDFSLAKEGFSDLGDQAKENIDKVKGAVKGVADTLKEAARIGIEIDKTIKAREALETTIASRNSELNKVLKEQQTILSDTARSGQERVDAANEAERIQQQLITNQNEIIDLSIKELQLKQSLNDTSREENKQLDELIAKRTDNLALLDAQEKQGIAARKKLQDEQQQAAKAAQEAAIKEQQAQLQLFIAQQGTRAKTLEENLKLSEEIFKRESKILEAELKNRTITQTQFDARLLELQNNLLQERVDAANEAAGRELEIFIEANQNKLDNDQFFSDESLRIEQERLDAIAEKQREFARTQLENGIINQTQYNDKINAIDNENRIANEEAQAERDEAQKEKDAIDLENKRIADEEAFQNAFALEAERIEIRRQQEIEEAEKTGADINLINEKYAAFRKTLENQVAEAKIQANQQSFDAIAGLLGQESGIGKIAASAAIINNTVQEATKAFNTAAVLAANPLTAALAPNATIQGIGIIARGAVQAGKLVTPKFKEGGINPVGGKRHSQGGTKYYGEDGNVFEAERGEGIGILNRAAFDSFMNFNNAFGSGQSRKGFFEGGGIISRAVPTNDNTSIELLTALRNMPAPIVTVEDIRSGNQSYVEVSDFANV